MGLDVILTLSSFKYILCFLAAIAGIFVISTKNPIISVFNLIVLYILVAFYLIYIGITYIGISYIIVYIGAIAILFLFVIMMIDIEVVDKRTNNYLPLLVVLLGGFLLALKKILYYLGSLKIKSLLYLEEDKYLIDFEQNILFNSMFDSNITTYYPGNNFHVNYFTKIPNDIIINYDNSISDANITQSNLSLNNDYNFNINTSLLTKTDFNNTSLILKDLDISSHIISNNYLLITPDWDSAVSRITQISAIGDVLYTTYHSFIYIVSVILLLGMVGAIILTADHNQQVRTITMIRNKNKASSIMSPLFLLIEYIIETIQKEKNNKKKNEIKPRYYNLIQSLYYLIFNKNVNSNIYRFSILSFYPFSDILDNERKHSEIILGNLLYYIISNIFIGLLLLLINSSFSLSLKYLEKGGGFECGFTSFIQTRERYNIIFYRVSLLFLVFDLEIILAFPYPAIYQKNQNSSKNNVLAFLYILVIGFIYELKEGALNIVKTAHSSDIKVDY
jgi:NADH-ubiquinone oxidoreductase chain 6